MSDSKILNDIKELLGLQKKEESKNDEVVGVAVLAEDSAQKESEEKKIDEAVKEQPMYVTSEQLSEVKNELLSMIKALIEENKKELQEVPQKLSAEKEEKEDIELSEAVEEIVHSPENEVEKKAIELHKPYGAMSPLERIQFNLNNK